MKYQKGCSWRKCVSFSWCSTQKKEQFDVTGFAVHVMTPLFHEFHWLPVYFWVQVKVFSVLHSLGLGYLQDLLSPSNVAGGTYSGGHKLEEHQSIWGYIDPLAFHKTLKTWFLCPGLKCNRVCSLPLLTVILWSSAAMCFYFLLGILFVFHLCYYKPARVTYMRLTVI